MKSSHNELKRKNVKQALYYRLENVTLLLCTKNGRTRTNQQIRCTTIRLNGIGN
jgi:hypothetical protein